MTAVNRGTGQFFFLDAPGGTGKKFVTSLILSTVRRNGQIALAVASSGIVATLLDGGRTAHSASELTVFNIHNHDDMSPTLTRATNMGKVLQQCSLIVWDECTMTHKKALELLNITLQDLRNNNRLFGGVVVLL